MILNQVVCVAKGPVMAFPLYFNFIHFVRRAQKNAIYLGIPRLVSSRENRYIHTAAQNTISQTRYAVSCFPLHGIRLPAV